MDVENYDESFYLSRATFYRLFHKNYSHIKKITSASDYCSSCHDFIKELYIAKT